MIWVTNPRVLLLNDTDVDGRHFGCARVMTILREQLSQRGVVETGAVRVSLNWRDVCAPEVLAADLVVINGEGTLHHGSRKGRWLLEAAQEVKAKGGKIALINALWQENPSEWGQLIGGADILACRDSRSAAALSTATGRTDVRLMGDLSMTQRKPISTLARSGILFGDSLHANITNHLASLASKSPDSKIVPITKTLKLVSPHLSGIRRKARTIYAHAKQRRFLVKNPSAQFMTDEASYIAELQTKAVSVTGRFHAACLAVLTRTPFIAVRSNSWKIEALLNDVGLLQSRLHSLDTLTTDILDPERWQFNQTEVANIEKALIEWQGSADILFDDIAALI